jgi:2-methylaconitate cis-trans-isomerase PrpF
MAPAATPPDSPASFAYRIARSVTSPDAPGSIAYRTTGATTSPDVPVRIAQPSGLTVVGASVRRLNEGWVADRATVYRTARRLMEGLVYFRAPAP